jgi:hypothetical protein
LQHVRHEEEEVGERESPCLSPRRRSIHRPGTPLSRIADLEVVRIWSIQSHHTDGNPRARRILRRLAHSTESKAFAKSSFRTKHGALRRKQV